VENRIVRKLLWYVFLGHPSKSFLPVLSFFMSVSESTSPPNTPASKPEPALKLLSRISSSTLPGYTSRFCKGEERSDKQRD